jgi:hypothetical protein
MFVMYQLNIQLTARVLVRFPIDSENDQHFVPTGRAFLINTFATNMLSLAGQKHGHSSVAYRIAAE